MGAIISDCGQYRYRLTRDCAGMGATAVIMVNPSTADATQDDATIRKLRGFGERHGWGRIIVGNLFAYRATDVRELSRAVDPVGPDNDEHLLRIAAEVDRAVFAWGPVMKQPRALRRRWERVSDIFGHLRPMTIGAPAKCGHPRHPLMLAYAEPILAWSAPA
ncbi:DUF1643 domain-containing protein [Sphingomonas sp. DC1100-1]|uniref:DUF1643 domain-containing protein n=1 Tax=unclassified Sphingomonas TaxID=196159 RepID=UPI003CF0D643